jgi:hypothetical protein
MENMSIGLILVEIEPKSCLVAGAQISLALQAGPSRFYGRDRRLVGAQLAANKRSPGMGGDVKADCLSPRWACDD